MTMPQFCESTGFSRMHVHRLMKRGLPHSRRKSNRGGRPSIAFNETRAMAWLTMNGVTPPKLKDAAAITASTPPPDAGPVQEQPESHAGPDATKLDQDLLATYGIIGALERVKRAEYYTAGCIASAHREQLQDPTRDLSAQIAAYQKISAQQSTQLRHMEAAALQHRRDCGELVSYDGMMQEWRRLILSIRTQIAGIPSQWPAKLRKWLHDPETMGDVEKAMHGWVRELLDNVPVQAPGGSEE